MTYPQVVSARLLDRDGTTVISGTPLANSFDRSFMDEFDGTGTGSLSLSLSEAGAAELTPGRFVDVQVDAVSRFTFQIEGDPEYLLIQEGEEVDQIVKVSGRGWGSVFDQAIVEPEADLDLNLPSPWRLFSFASPGFPNAGAWVAADELYEYLDGVTYGYRYRQAPDGLLYPSPISFPLNTSPNIYDPSSPPGANYVDTYWIWPPSEELSIGFAFFRKAFTIGSGNGAVYTFAITGDNFFTLFLEGIPILGENADLFIWKDWKEVTVALPEGTFQIGVVVENVDVPDLATNPAGMIMTVHTVDGAQLPDAAQVVTDDTWTCVFADDFWPGWTPGQIFATLISEAVARGSLTAYNSSTFAALTDSASNAWSDSDTSSPYIPAFGAEIGSTVMAALIKARDEGHLHWHVQPGILNLDIWAPGSIGASSGVVLAEGTNLRTLERGATTVYANALLVQWERGFVWVTDAAEITAFGSRVEDIFASEASSPDEAQRQGRVELDGRIASGWPAVVVTIEPTSSADAPYEGFELGETVNIPAIGGGTENVQVLSISMSEDSLGHAQWRCELNRRVRSIAKQDADLLRQIGGRSGLPTGSVR